MSDDRCTGSGSSTAATRDVDAAAFLGDPGVAQRRRGHPPAGVDTITHFAREHHKLRRKFGDVTGGELQSRGEPSSVVPKSIYGETGGLLGHDYRCF